MKPINAVSLYGIAVVILAALWSPWLFWALQSIAPHVSFGDWLAKQPFRRVFNRALLITALIGLWPLLRTIGIRSRAELGFTSTPHWWNSVLYGLSLGAGSFLLAGLVSIALGARALAFEMSASEFGFKLLKFAATGIIVAVIEETFFRGGIQGTLQRGIRQISALTVTSAVYSILHFLKPAHVTIPPEDARWWTGFHYLKLVLTHSFDAPGILVGFITLFLAGWILGWAFAKTGELYLAVGLHAGWVFALKSYSALTTTTEHPCGVWLGGRSLIENVATWPVLVVLWLIVARLCRKRSGSIS